MRKGLDDMVVRDFEPRESCEPSVSNESLELRKMLWLRHGCAISRLYGDDGEMQCNNFRAHKPIDFKRDSPMEIKRKLMPNEAVIMAIVNKRLNKPTCDICGKDPAYCECPEYKALEEEDEETKIMLENGKYIFVISNQGKVSCLRFGEPWVTFKEGSKAIISLIHKALEGGEDDSGRD